MNQVRAHYRLKNGEVIRVQFESDADSALTNAKLATAALQRETNEFVDMQRVEMAVI